MKPLQSGGRGRLIASVTAGFARETRCFHGNRRGAGCFSRDEDNKTLMNNRQAGRRRGRGGQRPQGGNSGQGSRIDNRSRGNANQLHEKYKTLARDAQMQGDRVNTEYYLQFADHYFRVLNETRSRQDEQNQRRQRDDIDDDTDNDVETEDRSRDSRRDSGDDHRGRYNGNGNGNGRANDDDDDDGDDGDDDRRPQQQPARVARPRRVNGQERANGQEREAPAPRLQQGDRAEHAEQSDVTPAEAPAEKRGRGRPRKIAAPAAEAPAMDADRLPPSLGISAVSSDDGEEKPRRRRGRPPASEASSSVS
jgi:hypothetical protein